MTKVYTGALPNLVCVRNASGGIEHYVTVFGGIRYRVRRTPRDDWEVLAFAGGFPRGQRYVGRLLDARIMIGNDRVIAGQQTPTEGKNR